MTAKPIPLCLAGLTLSLALGIASCGPARNEFAPACPTPGLVRELADLERYRAPARDVRDLIVRAHIDDVRGTCEPGDDTSTVVANALVVIVATRGPAFTGNEIDLPLFVAVTDQGAILDKSTLALRIEFPANVDTVRVQTQPVRMVLPVSPQKSAAAYGVFAGFQLTPQEVEAWRRANRH